VAKFRNKSLRRVMVVRQRICSQSLSTSTHLESSILDRKSQTTILGTESSRRSRSTRLSVVESREHEGEPEDPRASFSSGDVGEGRRRASRGRRRRVVLGGETSDERDEDICWQEEEEEEEEAGSK